MAAQLGSDYVNDDELALLYAWIDNIPKLSRPKRNITRDFADGVMLAEVIHFHIPKLVEIHNYQASSSKKHKKENWDTLNKKVLRKFKKLHVPDNVIEAIISCKPGTVEVVLTHVRRAIMKVKQPKAYAEEEAQRNLAAHTDEHDPTGDEGNNTAGVAEASDDGRSRKNRNPRGRGGGRGSRDDGNDDGGHGKKGDRDSAALGSPPGSGKARDRQAPQVGNARSGPGGVRTGPGPGDKGRAKGKPGGLARV